MVDSLAESNGAKLRRLLQNTPGKARDTICHCEMPENGYKLAHDILHKNFGVDHLVTEKIVQSLRAGRPVRYAEELQALAVELSTSLNILSQVNQLEELESQACMVEIV